MPGSLACLRSLGWFCSCWPLRIYSYATPLSGMQSLLLVTTGKGPVCLVSASNTVQLTAYAINGILSALAGIIFAAQIGFIPNTAGNGMEMRAIASGVLGGVSLLGGTGTVIGAALGAFFMTAIDSVLVMLRFDAYWNDMIAGAILLIVLIGDGRIREAMAQSLRYQKYRKFLEPDEASINAFCRSCDQRCTGFRCPGHRH